MILEDVLAEDLVVVFVATTATDRSARTEAYYAGKGNKFWRTLFRVRLTPRQFRPEEYNLLLAHDMGLTDMVKKRTAVDAELTDADFEIDPFLKKIKDHGPAIVAFNGKEAAKRALSKPTVSYGMQKEKLYKSMVFVLPSTADQANDYWDEGHWRELAAAVRKARRT